MIACLICPSPRPTVPLLSERTPLAAMELMGQSLLEYWMSDLAANGFRTVLVLAHDRAELIRKRCGNGSRWGMDVQVLAEPRELTPAQALLKYGEKITPEHVNNIWTVDHFPGMPESPLFESYAGFFAAVERSIPKALTIDRVGVKEIRPGVFAELHAFIAPDADLRAPCWIGRNTFIGSRAVVGPGAVIERGAFVEPDTEITRSHVGEDTFVGRFAQVSGSIAIGSTLVDWGTGSAAFVPDPFLLCSLRPDQSRSADSWVSKISELYSRNKAEVVMACKQLLMRKES